jgi:excisionase family DNA binding protein
MTVKEAALYLLLTEDRVAELCREGVLKAHKDGKRWVIDDDAIRVYKQTPRSNKHVGKSWRKGMVLHRGMTRCITCQHVYKNTLHLNCPYCHPDS